MRLRVGKIVFILILASFFAPPSAFGKALLKDGAHLFDEAGAARVLKLLDEASKARGYGLRVVTVRHPVSHEADFTRWARAQAESHPAKELLFIISIDPEYIVVAPGRTLKSSGVITLAMRDSLTGCLAKAFSSKDFEGGLREASEILLGRRKMVRSTSVALTDRPLPRSVWTFFVWYLAGAAICGAWLGGLFQTVRRAESI